MARGENRERGEKKGVGTGGEEEEPSDASGDESEDRSACCCCWRCEERDDKTEDGTLTVPLLG